MFDESHPSIDETLILAKMGKLNLNELRKCSLEEFKGDFRISGFLPKGIFK